MSINLKCCKNCGYTSQLSNSRTCTPLSLDHMWTCTQHSLYPFYDYYVIDAKFYCKIENTCSTENGFKALLNWGRKIKNKIYLY